jgi:hypothetical protein
MCETTCFPGEEDDRWRRWHNGLILIKRRENFQSLIYSFKIIPSQRPDLLVPVFIQYLPHYKEVSYKYLM